MTSQALIDFGREYHVENNPESQENYNENKKHFSNQCKIVYEALLRGERLTTERAMFVYRIFHLPRRIKTLKDEHKINIKSIWEGEGRRRHKVWFV